MSLLFFFAGAGYNLNVAPTADAGPDANATTGSVFGLMGSVDDDGLPSGTLTSLWTQQSGPASAVFVDATNPTTVVTCPVVGSYVLRLTASDGSLTGFDEMTITVSDPPSGGDGHERPWIKVNWL